MKLPAYPHQEFGAIKGELSAISTIPTDSGFVAKVALAQGLYTTYHKQLAYKEGLKAEVEIITSDKRLSDRLLHQLLSLLKNR